MSAAGKATQKTDDAASLLRYRRMLDDARSLTQEARLQSGIDRDYYDGHQLTPEEIAVLRTRKQPQLVINRVRRGIDGILGIAEQARTDPRAYLRNPPDPGTQGPVQPVGQPQPGQQVMGGNGGPPMQAPHTAPLDAADVATMSLRFIADTNHFRAIKQDVLENGLVEGCGAAIIEFQQEIIVTQIRWEEFFYDPRSRRPDFMDARYMGVAKWMYSDQVAAIYPKKKDELEGAANGDSVGVGAFDITWQDKPDTATPWVDLKERRLMVVELYYQEAGKWLRCVFFAGGILEPAAPSPYVDDKKNPICPIEAWSCYVDRNNRRYGQVRDMRGPQDEINMRRSKLLHMLNVRQIQPASPDAPPVDADSARQEAARPDGVIPPGWQLIPYAANMQGQSDLLAEAKGEIERLGPSPAILGRQGADASGRAVQLRQQAGMTEFARVLGRFNDWELRCYKQMWARARQFWTDPKWIRVTNDNAAPQYVRLNEPAPVNPMTGQPAGPPQNHVALMDVDIIVDTVPDTATLQQEQFNEFMQLAQSNPGSIPIDILIDLSSVPKKEELKKRLEAYQAQQAQGQQAAAQLKQQSETADTAKKIADAHKSAAAADETQANINLKNAQAGLAEVQTVTTAMEGHLKATAAAALPSGVTLDGSGNPVHLTPASQTVPPTETGANGAPQPST